MNKLTEARAWELRKGATDRVLIEITNNPARAHDWRCSLEEVVPLYSWDTVEAAVLAEREACAQIAEKPYMRHVLAQMIRARGKE
jgi:hypothetical protein